MSSFAPTTERPYFTGLHLVVAVEHPVDGYHIAALNKLDCFMCISPTIFQNSSSSPLAVLATKREEIKAEMLWQPPQTLYAPFIKERAAEFSPWTDKFVRQQQQQRRNFC
jgi:hypothetical protein